MSFLNPHQKPIMHWQHVEVMGLNIGLAILIKLILKAVLSQMCGLGRSPVAFVKEMCKMRCPYCVQENLNEMFKEFCYV